MSLVTVLAAGAVMAQAYKWVDEDGVVHYSDRPEAGAQEIQLPTQRRPAGPPALVSPPVRQQQQTTAPAFSYDTIEITTPVAEETLWNLEGVLDVALTLRPGLQPGHLVRVYFDGTPQLVNGTSFQIQEVYRGTHNLQVEVVDQDGNLMGRSEPSRFFVQQNSIVGN